MFDVNRQTNYQHDTPSLTVMRYIKRLYYRIKFGKATYEIVDTINGIVCEAKILDRNGNVVGYWAYGNNDPSYPYRFKEEL